MNDWACWNTSTIADRLGFTRKYVEERIVSHPTFPVPLEITDGGRPRWIASEVIAWAEARRRAA